MEELFKELEELNLRLDNLDQVKELKKYSKKLQKDLKLLDDIKLYKDTNNERIKENIINNQEYRDYKKCENEINFLILEINKRLKRINPKGRKCK